MDDMQRIYSWQKFIIPSVLRNAPESETISCSCGYYPSCGIFVKHNETTEKNLADLMQDNIVYFESNGYYLTIESYSGDELYCKEGSSKLDCFQMVSYEKDNATILAVTFYDR
ncbi:hypothetical protein JW962_04165 [Candidatus Dojkabacteria bacterium]|nr:hypothetical protein [Candidatus Dojkabacteria bacterium]